MRKYKYLDEIRTWSVITELDGSKPRAWYKNGKVMEVKDENGNPEDTAYIVYEQYMCGPTYVSNEEAESFERRSEVLQIQFDFGKDFKYIKKPYDPLRPFGD